LDIDDHTSPNFTLHSFCTINAWIFHFLHWETRWGSTSEERALEMPGDVYLEGGSKARVSMTRAISIAASPQTV